MGGDPLWLTAYLFFEGHVYGETADRVIREVVAPLARACRPYAVRWFFLRYAEEASHVRLRFFAPGPVLEETIWPRVAEAGIAWFLGELYRATGEAEVGRAARGGLEHALARGDHLSNLFGFHSGRVGLVWVAFRLAEIFERPDDAERARRLLAPLAGRESHDTGLDVIGGAIPACLDLAEKAGWDELRAMARELGEHLIGQAQRRPDGWSWATGGEIAVRNLTGFAHGASGVGLALLELDRATGDGRFRFAAEMAFLYERRLFNEERSNWPDLRHKDLGDALLDQRMDELRRAVRDGKPPVWALVDSTEAVLRRLVRPAWEEIDLEPPRSP